MIFLLAHPRTGSTALMRAFRETGKLIVLDEPFHPDASYGLRDGQNAGKLDQSIPDFLASEGIGVTSANFAHHQPLKTLAALEKLSAIEQKPLLVSLFPQHIHPRNLIKALSRYCSKAIILKRHPIDVFISAEKAKRLKKWGGVDTTELKIEAPWADFDRFFLNASSWYLTCGKILNDLAVETTTVSYESLFSETRGAAESRRLLDSIGIACHGLAFNKMRQDKSDNWTDKVTNAREFERMISDYHLDKVYSSF